MAQGRIIGETKTYKRGGKEFMSGRLSPLYVRDLSPTNPLIPFTVETTKMKKPVSHMSLVKYKKMAGKRSATLVG